MRTRVAVLSVATVAALGTAGCGDGDDAPTTGGGETADAVEIADFEYAPEALTVPAGTTVTWSNSDDASHTATADDGSFDTGTLKRGEDAGVVLDEAGTYTYYCRFHAFMKATVEVE